MMKNFLVLLLSLAIYTFSYAQTPCENASGVIVASGYSTTNDGYYQQCAGGEITFSCENIVLPNDGTAAAIDWYVNGSLQPSQPNQSLTLSYDNPKLLEISAEVISSESCFLVLELDMPVAFLSYPEPLFNDISTACLNEGGTPVEVGNISTIVQPTTVHPFGGGYLPDGSGLFHIEEFTVDGATQEYINDCNDIEYVMLNMEHSYAGDLTIRLTCPNGNSVNILQYPSGLGSSYLGEPIDDNPIDNLQPGIGYDYFWSMSADSSMFNALQSPSWLGGSIPSGYYLPTESFCALVGCPINGVWSITIIDNLGGDNGYLFHGNISLGLGTVAIPPYDYTESSFNQYAWSSDEFIITNEGVIQANVQPGDENIGTLSYTYTNPAGCSGTASTMLEFIENPISVSVSDDFIFNSNQANIITANIVTLGNDSLSIEYGWTPASAVIDATQFYTEVLPVSEDTWIAFTANMVGYYGCTAVDSLLVSVPDNAVMLTVFHDANENGIYDEGENTIPFFPVDGDVLGTLYTSSQGTILTSFDDATTFEINVDASDWELTTPSYIEVDETQWTGYVLNYYFGVKPTANLNVEVEVALSGITPLCNSTSWAQASIFNTGNYYPGGQVVITLDPLYTFTSSNPEPSSIAGNVLTYQVGSLFYHEQFAVSLVLQNPTETSFGQITTHTIQGFYTISEGSLSEVQDTDTAELTIICAYDPNNKLTHTGAGEANLIEPNTDLEYTINFQNIGNAPATTVILTDEISDLLDIASLQPIAWSHDFVLNVDGDIATFVFEDIQLLGVEQNEAKSHGFVRFKIKQQPNLAPATVIENIAEIVFDNNEAIITNTAVNTIITPTNIAELEKNMLSVFPNPASDVIYWNNANYRLVKVISALGKTVVSKPTIQNSFNLSSLPSGIYLLQFESSTGKVVRKEVIKQ